MKELDTYLQTVDQLAGLAGTVEEEQRRARSNHENKERALNQKIMSMEEEFQYLSRNLDSNCGNCLEQAHQVGVSPSPHPTPQGIPDFDSFWKTHQQLLSTFDQLTQAEEFTGRAKYDLYTTIMAAIGVLLIVLTSWTSLYGFIAFALFVLIIIRSVSNQGMLHWYFTQSTQLEDLNRSADHRPKYQLGCGVLVAVVILTLIVGSADVPPIVSLFIGALSVALVCSALVRWVVAYLPAGRLVTTYGFMIAGSVLVLAGLISQTVFFILGSTPIPWADGAYWHFTLTIILTGALHRLILRW